MTQPLYRSRPGGFQIRAASMPEARMIREDIYVSEGLSNTVACNKAEDLICPNDFDPEIVSLGRISYWLDLVEFISWKLRSSRVDRQDIVS